jgi:hypothetical protein
MSDTPVEVPVIDTLVVIDAVPEEPGKEQANVAIRVVQLGNNYPVDTPALVEAIRVALEAGAALVYGMTGEPSAEHIHGVITAGESLYDLPETVIVYQPEEG